MADEERAVGYDYVIGGETKQTAIATEEINMVTLPEGDYNFSVIKVTDEVVPKDEKKGTPEHNLVTVLLKVHGAKVDEYNLVNERLHITTSWLKRVENFLCSIGTIKRGERINTGAVLDSKGKNGRAHFNVTEWTNPTSGEVRHYNNPRIYYDYADANGYDAHKNDPREAGEILGADDDEKMPF